MGFRVDSTLPGCGAECREGTREREVAATLDNSMAQGNPKLTLLEGWTNMVESAGFYRSDHWEYPTQYISIGRKYADPTPATLRFQAEGTLIQRQRLSIFRRKVRTTFLTLLSKTLEGIMRTGNLKMILEGAFRVLRGRVARTQKREIGMWH
jgi:hypothetical protein